MTASKEKHLTELIAKFYNISERSYNGKTYDNVLNIFDELDLEEQKAILRGALGIYAATASGLIHDKDLIDHGDADALLGYIKKLQDEKLKVEASSIDKNNTSSKGRKTLLDRPTLLTVCSVIAVLLVTITSSALSSEAEEFSQMTFIKHFLSILLIAK